MVGPTVAVGEPGNGTGGIAVGEGAVWVATAGGCTGSVSRIDPGTREVSARLPLGEVYDVAVEAGAVWALAAEPCSRTRQDVALLRIDPRSEQVVARIPLDVSRGGRRADHAFELVAGEGALWVAVNFSPTVGEVLRIDSQTNGIAARVDARGWVGEMVVGAGAVWFLAHPEYTDETRVKSASLYRIDPATNELSAPVLDKELLHLGAALIPPVLAAGEDALWVTAQEVESPYRAIAVRVHAHGNDVTRRRLSLKHFYPLVETDSGLWFIGAGLSRLDPRTLEVAESVELDVPVGDAAFDPATGTLWIAALTLRSEDRGAVVPVDLR